MDAPITAFTAFIDIGEEDQMTELEQYLNAKGISVNIDEEDIEFEVRFRRIVEKSCAIFQNQAIQLSELEGLLYCIASLFHMLQENTASLLEAVCKMITTGTNQDNARHRLKMLGLLFCQFESKDPMSLIVLKHEFQFAIDYNAGHLLNINLTTLKKWMKCWKLSVDDGRQLLKQFWEASKSTSNKSLRIDILKELLSLSSSSQTEEGTDDLATELIVLVLADSHRYVFNNILQLESVKNLQSQKIYKLLQIFVEEKLPSFIKFCETDKEYLESLGLDYSVCEHKMQLLTLLSLAVGSSEIPFSLLSSELGVGVSEIEQLVIDAVRLQLLSARMDHVNQKLLVTSCVHRTFGPEQWQHIYDRLSSWKQSISTLQSNIKTLHITPLSSQ